MGQAWALVWTVRMLRDLVWLEEEGRTRCGCEVELHGWDVDQVGTWLRSGLGPAGLWGSLLPTRPKTMGQRVRKGKRGRSPALRGDWQDLGGSGRGELEGGPT